MSVRKRGSTWFIDYIDPSGKRVRKAFKNKKQATDEHAKRVSLIAEGRYLDVKKDCKITFGELIQKYKENYQHQSSFKNGKKLYLKNFEEYFKSETMLNRFRYVDLVTYRNNLRQKLTIYGMIRTTAAVNRELACLHHLFSEAKAWGMIEGNPFTEGKTLIEKENNARLRFLSEEEIPRLLDSCSPFPHLHDIVTCALNTGMRKGEILSLRWDQIRNGLIYLQKTKTNTSRQIPINDTLDELFKGIRKRQKVGAEYVFTYSQKQKDKGFLRAINPEEGTRINNVQVSFTNALRRADIKDFHFHDLRHTFASHMIMRGASLKEVQEILGHANLTMTMRYAHLSQESKKKAINLLNGLTEPHAQTGDATWHKMAQTAI